MTSSELRKLQGRRKAPSARDLGRRPSSLRVGSSFALKSIGALSCLAAQASAHEVTPRGPAPQAPLPEFVSWERSTQTSERAQERQGFTERLRSAETWVVDLGALPLVPLALRPPRACPAPRTHAADFLRRFHVARFRGRDPPLGATSPKV